MSIVGGYLGTGKTTLLNAVLSRTDERIACLVNDFGAVDIDAALLSQASDGVIELADGCICCSLADGFLNAMNEVRRRSDRLDRVIVEVSGVGDPGQVARWADTPGFVLDTIVVLTDLHTLSDRLDDPWLADTVERQLDAADLLLTTCIGEGTSSQVQAASEALAARWSQLPTVTSHDAVDLLAAPVVLPVPAAVRPSGDGAIGAEAPPTDSHPTRSVVVADELSEERLDAWLAAAPASVLRAKGLLRTPGGVAEVHVAGRRQTWWRSGIDSPAVGRLIGIAHPAADPSELEGWLGSLSEG